MTASRTTLLLGCLSVAACSPRVTHTTADTPKGSMSVAVSIDAPSQTALRSAQLVFLGEVLALDASPGIWSSRTIAYQRVEYRVLRVLRASPKISTAERIAILHPLIARSPTVDPSEPRLHPDRFRVGARLVIAARLDEEDGAVQAMDADRAVLTGSEDWVSAVERTLRE